MAKRLARHEVPVEQTWDLEGLYPTTAAWEADLAKVDALVPTVTAFQGRLGEGAPTLLACLKAVDALSELATQVFWFAYNRCTVDQGNPEVQALRDRGMAMTARVQSALAFLKPEILALPDGTVKDYLETEPGLAMYALFLFDILA
ncbi:MAG TPA: oligoendopeptidase F, partial [Symbiobacteriaceae bacterium]|nr:oligoendopeptidase F [Symbiobacteriaceae bacterium]